ncbi:enamine deaminase RidA (YjgF/YER057c/UK114 family) [Pigmentiphaga kullae]|uniref:Enamine deaminase RidA (YjgF/YER057c/UK114 family) n=2 Tax=Pigmentiphaga kullae TaxID=151784 RepID=A0A4Q7ND78_9BURK|nr:enamine deaminase RidA (YjgF/YER057c/UK114 family) [Pigmentiphaga kullae]
MYGFERKVKFKTFTWILETIDMQEAREILTQGKPWPDRYTYVPALRIGNMVWLSGTTGTDETGTITAPGDIVEQTRQIFRKFDALLKAAGGSCNDIVQTHDFFVTTENYAGTADVRREFFTTARPTSSGVKVAALLRKDALIEISAMAVIGSAPAA